MLYTRHYMRPCLYFTVELPILEHMKKRQGGGQEAGSSSAAANVDTSQKKQSQLVR